VANLAIQGGPKVRTTLFPKYITIGAEEKEAVGRVIDSGILSNFLGCWHEHFYGGPEVRSFEAEWAKYFGVKHAIAVNSATSGIYCALGATGIGPGDEVIVSPYTMSASSVAPLVYNAIPVFADIEEDYFCLDPNSIEERITPRTKAIVVVDIFGLPYHRDAINVIAKKHNLLVVEDCAQGPGAMYHGKYAGTLADLGIFSLNYHKHIHTGEGGMVVTDNDDLAEKVRLIRNHAEAVVGAKGTSSLINMIGFNYRMTELEAAVGKEQLKKLPNLLERRLTNVTYLTKQLSQIPCLEPAKIRENCKHSFYVHPIKYHREIAGIHRNRFIAAVQAELMPTEKREKEGIKIGCGYVQPLYWQPIYQQLTAYPQGCPWTCEKYKGKPDYHKGLCPVTERMHLEILITHELMTPSMTKPDLDDVVAAFAKVWKYREELA